jgi:hypothetical protein
MVEYVIMRMFSKQTIFSLVDVLFKDMQSDFELIEGKIGNFFELDDSLKEEEEKCYSQGDYIG